MKPRWSFFVAVGKQASSDCTVYFWHVTNSVCRRRRRPDFTNRLTSCIFGQNTSDSERGVELCGAWRIDASSSGYGQEGNA